jgi:hypothetical protein
MKIKLSYDEILQGAIVGTLRQLENLRDNRKSAHGCGTANDWQLHIEGALGELALAKHLGWYWSKGIFRGDDVHNFQVRTRSKHYYDLILHPDDPDDKNFYLVTGVNGEYRIRGWIKGIDGKQDKHWKDPAGGRPAFFVPVSELNGDY